jgi:hypothetical protein
MLIWWTELSKIAHKRFFKEPHGRWGTLRNLLRWWGFLQEPNCPTETLGFEFEWTASAGT